MSSGGRISSSGSGLAGQKARVREFWNAEPCGTGNNPNPPMTREYFEWIERQRDAREPFIERFARWNEWRGKRVLEMGIGAATDFIKFARAGADLYGVDLTENSIRLARARLAHERLAATAMVADIERLPFPAGSFDFVYSWGVIHHTEDTAAAAREVVRVTKPGGSFCVMIYHRRSLQCLQGYLVHGLLRGRFASLDAIVRDHFESYGTKVYTEGGARRLFGGQSVTLTHVLTPYDFQFSRRWSLPWAFSRIVPDYFGYFLVVQGRKTQGGQA